MGRWGAQSEDVGRLERLACQHDSGAHAELLAAARRHRDRDACWRVFPSLPADSWGVDARRDWLRLMVAWGDGTASWWLYQDALLRDRGRREPVAAPWRGADIAVLWRDATRAARVLSPGGWARFFLESKLGLERHLAALCLAVASNGPLNQDSALEHGYALASDARLGMTWPLLQASLERTLRRSTRPMLTFREDGMLELSAQMPPLPDMPLDMVRLVASR